MKYLIAALLFLGTISGCASMAAVNDSVNTDVKSHIGSSHSGYMFQIDGQPYPWVCRPRGNGLVECDMQNKRFNCTYANPPVFFTDCKEMEDEVPVGITIIPVQ